MNYDTPLEYVATHILQRRQPEIVQLVALLPYLDLYFNSPTKIWAFFAADTKLGLILFFDRLL